MIIIIIRIIIALAGSKNLPAFLNYLVISNKQLEKISIWQEKTVKFREFSILFFRLKSSLLLRNCY